MSPILRKIGYSLMTVTALTAVLVVSACAGSNAEATPPSDVVWTEHDAAIWEVEVHLSDGRDVTCLTVHANGISCDWDGAKE
jgi:hypothetical protein